MTVNNIDVYRDGGTIKIDTDEGTYYVDRRIRSETKGRVYDDYPKRGNLIENDTELKTRLYEALNGYTHTFYTNIPSIREFILHG